MKSSKNKHKWKKNVIQVWGKAGSGKTSTVKLIREELIKLYQNRYHKYNLPFQGGEIYVVLDCEGIKIGLQVWVMI